MTELPQRTFFINGEPLDSSTSNPKTASGSDTESLPHRELEFARNHDEEHIAILEANTEKLINDFSTASDEDRFYMIRQFTLDRREQLFDHMNGGDFRLGSVEAFNTLNLLEEQTESVYTKRFIEWAKLREAHEFLDAYSGDGLLDLDKSMSTDEANEAWYYGENPESGAVYAISNTGTELIEDWPESRDIIEFAVNSMSEYPHLGEDGSYPPSPYSRLIPSTYDNRSLPEGEVELSLETLHVLGLSSEDDISEEARAQLFRFGVGLSESRYQRMQKTMSAIPENARPKVAEAFLAIEFGDDFGDRILSIAEHATPEESARVFELAGRYREHSKRFAGFFKNLSPELATATEKAMNERVTDLITTVEKVARDGGVYGGCCAAP